MQSPTRTTLPAWGGPLLGLLACAAVLLWVQSLVGLYMPDDAYITYRYAENLAAGRGLVFNAATPPVEGYSNLSWIVLLAGLARLGLDLPVWAAQIGRVLSLLNLLLVYGLSLAIVRHRGWALIAPALLALTAPYALWARGGLETMWYATLLLVSLGLVWLGLGGRNWPWPLAAVALFTLTLTRHDGAIPVATSGIVVLLWALSRARQPRSAEESARGPVQRVLQTPGLVAALTSFAVLTVTLLAYNWWRGQYFGQLVPAPFFSRLGGTLANPAAVAHTLASYFTIGAHYSAYGDLLVPGFAAAAAGFWVARRPGWRDWLLLLPVAGLSFLYFISESYNPGIRYMVPLLPLLALYAQRPLIWLLEYVTRQAGGGWRRWAAPGAVAAAVALYLLVMAPRTQADGAIAEQAKLRSLVPLGQWLHSYAPPGATVALQDIGTVAYYSGVQVIDNNPGALTNGDLIYRAGQAGFADITLGPRPTFLVFTSFSHETPSFYNEFATLLTDPRFTEGYALYGKIKYWPDRYYWVYKRLDVNLPTQAQAAFPASQ